MPANNTHRLTAYYVTVPTDDNYGTRYDTLGVYEDSHNGFATAMETAIAEMHKQHPMYDPCVYYYDAIKCADFVVVRRTNEDHTETDVMVFTGHTLTVNVDAIGEVVDNG